MAKPNKHTRFVNSLAIYKFCIAFTGLLFCVDVLLFGVYKKLWSPLF